MANKRSIHGSMWGFWDDLQRSHSGVRLFL